MNEEEKQAVEELKGCIFFWQGQAISSDNEEDLKIAEKEISINKTILNLIEKLQKKNESLKQEITVLQNTKDTCPEFNTSGVRCSLKQENEELKTQIPNLKNGTYIGDYQGLLKLEKEITERENIIKQLRTEVNSLKKDNKELKQENKTLKNRITELENEIQDLNRYRNGKNINLQKYLINQLKRYRKE